MSSTMRDPSAQTSELRPVETDTLHENHIELDVAIAVSNGAKLPRRERRRTFWSPIRERIKSKKEHRDGAVELSPVTSLLTRPAQQPRSKNTSRRGGRRGGGRVGHGYNHGIREYSQGPSLPFDAHMRERFMDHTQYHPNYGFHPLFPANHDLVSQQFNRTMWFCPLGYPTQQARHFELQQQVPQVTSHIGQRPTLQANGPRTTQEVPLIVFSSHSDGLVSHNETVGNDQSHKLGGLMGSTVHDLDLLAVASRTPLIVPEGGLELDDTELEAECCEIDPVVPDSVIPDPESSNLVPRGAEVDWDGQTRVARYLHEDHTKKEVVLRKGDVLASNEAFEKRMALVKKLNAAGETALASSLRSQSWSPISDDSSFWFTDDSTMVDEPQELPPEFSAQEALLHGQRLHVARKIGLDSPFAPRSFSEDWLPLL